MADRGLNLEVEIKLQLGSFPDYLKLIGFLGAVESEERHINGFFDTEDRRLAESGWVLRVRAEDDRGLVTLKSLGAPRGAAVVREEMEAEIGRAVAMEVLNLRMDVLGLAVEPVEYVKKEFPELSLARLIQFHNTRQKKRFKIGDYHYTLEIDRTEFADGSIDYELEVELKDADRVEVIQDCLRHLFTSLGIAFVPQEKSKYERALRRAGLI
ncbi:MAG TPA: CYTH domain-containing protein [Acidobacteriota bacterium]|nr:CYTH domain-containing protein [Acidobacteriota bacterium]